ncbi:MAG: bacteriophage N4 adsorption protein A [Sphingomonadaceae bacterium]|uniref:hypothetical protein n=1 Tax=Thermaurantiacus sp. TaxID=2820283 RepID=UPI00298F3E1B|nr:hypothetical protein [Thermaurantiacus sp.]MCS6987718.1 bacteriophage N4 adsorption protein A [Sphingomonadaceae bacterium]MDW8415062.1 hypothetical protein [Thermaurantiacus sp.]
MSELEPPRPGRALRLYQVLAVLLAGWAAGRLPELLDETRPESAPAPAAPVAVQDAAALAAAVASQVAGETVARLVAAGWGPPDRLGPAPAPAPPPPAPPANPVRTPPVVVPIRLEAVDPVLGFRLPPSPPASVPTGPDPSAATPPAAPAVAAPRTAAAGASPEAAERAYALASDAYAALRSGDRRAAADGLARAIALAPDAPNAPQWRQDLRPLTRRFSASMYALLRHEGGGDPLAATPVLGATQTGLSLGFTPNPQGRRRLTVFARVASGADATGALDPDTTEAAIGLRVDPFPRASVSAAVERRFAVGRFALDAWAARLAAGGSGSVEFARRTIAWDVYAEGGIVDFQDPIPYGGLQARGLTPLFEAGRLRLAAGAGLWAAGQEGFTSSHRLDLGPVIELRPRRSPVAFQLDYRWQVAGNALPRSGAALTLVGDF